MLSPEMGDRFALHNPWVPLEPSIRMAHGEQPGFVLQNYREAAETECSIPGLLHATDCRELSSL